MWTYSCIPCMPNNFLLIFLLVCTNTIKRFIIEKNIKIYLFSPFPYFPRYFRKIIFVKRNFSLLKKTMYHSWTKYLMTLFLLITINVFRRSIQNFLKLENIILHCFDKSLTKPCKLTKKSFSVPELEILVKKF